MVKFLWGGAKRKKAAEKKVKGTGKGKATKLDEGKIMALYRAGWSINKIADEMGSNWHAVKAVIDKKISDPEEKHE